MKSHVRKSTDTLQHGEATLRALLESAVQAILAIGAHGNLVLVNRMANTMFGYAPNELLDQPVELLLPTDTRDHHRQHLQAFFLNPKSRPMGMGLDLMGQRKDGSVFPIEISLNTMDTSEGKLLAVAFISDITGRKQTEAALAESRDESRALAARLLTDLEDERRRVSRDLHDQICQTLGSLASDLSELAANPPPPNEASSQFKALQARVMTAAEEARHLAYQLRPAVLDDLGLVVALKDLCTQFSTRETLPVEFDSGAMPARMRPEMASCLYRIAEESLGNAAKHARAKHISVTLGTHDQAVLLIIEDDGVGFDMEAVKGRGRLGLIGMVERARLLQGTLTVDAHPNSGTRITVELPLTE